MNGSVSPTIEKHPIRTSFIQRLPFSATHYRYYLPLLPIAIESFDLTGYDLIISSSHGVALVDGSMENIMITRPEDLTIGEAILAARNRR